MAQCCENILPSFSKCLGVQKVCLGFKRFHRNVDKKYFLKSENHEKNKIMILGIHYFITKLKTKIDVIQRGCFNNIVYQLQTYLNDPSSKILPSSTYVTIMTGTALRNVFLLLCLAISMPASVIKIRGQTG